MTLSVAVRWLSLFADVPAEAVPRELAFLSGACNAGLGRAEGARDEFVPVAPLVGDRWVWVQRVGRPNGGWHLDLHVDDPDAAAGCAVSLGATVRRSRRELVTLESPHGVPFCLVEESGTSRSRAPATRLDDGHRTRLDDLDLSVAAAQLDAELAFWNGLTGWTVDGRHGLDGGSSGRRLQVPGRLPLGITVSAGRDGATAVFHSDDVPSEIARHRRLGACLDGATPDAPDGTVARSPAGLQYRIAPS